ncbi:MAG: dihydrofolate reductase family protein [Cyanobacteriota bacterium]|nr:dihydrofolate reductase family protein [Cyanobacteriota bacterium]
MSPVPDQTRPFTRLVLAVSLDGRLAPPAGGAAQIGGRGDRRVLEEALAWADAALVGAETLRRHRSTALIHHADLLEGRAAAGRSPQPLALVASGGGIIPPELPFFRQPLERWLLAPPGVETRAQTLGFHRGLPLHNWAAAMADLAELGMHRMALLGGARLAAALLSADLVDELQLTLCPQLLGGGHTWLPAGSMVPGRTWRLLEQRELGAGELLVRYGITPSRASG